MSVGCTGDVHRSHGEKRRTGERAVVSDWNQGNWKPVPLDCAATVLLGLM